MCSHTSGKVCVTKLKAEAVPRTFLIFFPQDLVLLDKLREWQEGEIKGNVIEIREKRRDGARMGKILR